eukprot:439139-Pelagomonas_calceolata.AAC.1
MLMDIPKSLLLLDAVLQAWLQGPEGSARRIMLAHQLGLANVLSHCKYFNNAIDMFKKQERFLTSEARPQPTRAGWTRIVCDVKHMF